MDNNTLFRELAKHYKFTEKDWWQHRQSGSWILAHSAVLKLSCVPTPEGDRGWSERTKINFFSSVIYYLQCSVL